MQDEPEREPPEADDLWGKELLGCFRTALWALLWVTGVLILITFILGLACVALFKFG